MTEDAQSFLIYNLPCPLFLYVYIDSSVLVALHFVLFKIINGITAPSPCLNSHISFPTFFTVKTNRGRKPVLLESPISENNDSFIESFIRQDRNDEI